MPNWFSLGSLCEGVDNLSSFVPNLSISWCIDSFHLNDWKNSFSLLYYEHAAFAYYLFVWLLTWVACNCKPKDAAVCKVQIFLEVHKNLKKNRFPTLFWRYLKVIFKKMVWDFFKIRGLLTISELYVHMSMQTGKIEK